MRGLGHVQLFQHVRRQHRHRQAIACLPVRAHTAGAGTARQRVHQAGSAPEHHPGAQRQARVAAAAAWCDRRHLRYVSCRACCLLMALLSHSSSGFSDLALLAAACCCRWRSCNDGRHSRYPAHGVRRTSSGQQCGSTWVRTTTSGGTREQSLSRGPVWVSLCCRVRSSKVCSTPGVQRGAKHPSTRSAYAWKAVRLGLDSCKRHM